MPIKQLLILLAGLLLLPHFAFCRENPTGFSVALFVTADENIKSRIESSLSKGLSELDGVTLTPDNYEYVISVVATQLFTKSGQETGVVLSVNIHQKFDNREISFMFNEKYRDRIIEATERLYRQPTHWLRAGASGDLPAMCRRIIKDFDAQILQSRRDEFKNILDAAALNGKK